jgi:uncharacterized protein (TIGR02646 family)
MRPVERGDPPRPYGSYQEARPDLEARLGRFCSYCERYVTTHLAVEHARPKSKDRDLALEWSNLLLACVNCNSAKGTRQPAAATLWPDTDNPLLALRYISGGLVEVRPDVDTATRTGADALIAMVGLDRYPGGPGPQPTTADGRWQQRNEAWTKAEHYRRQLASGSSQQLRQMVACLAAERGMFSIWWTVFEGDADMRRRLREVFPGTSAACFDANESAVARPGAGCARARR